MPADQKRAPDLIIGGHELPCGCWELNSGPLEVLNLRPISSAHSFFLNIYIYIYIYNFFSRAGKSNPGSCADQAHPRVNILNPRKDYFIKRVGL
jgi:hypothetical protein